jgi:hypothetical protein
MAGGGEISARMPEARGSIRNPLSEAELLQKFTDCASVVLSPEQAARAGAALLDLERAPDLSSIIRLLNPQGTELA